MIKGIKDQRRSRVGSPGPGAGGRGGGWGGGVQGGGRLRRRLRKMAPPADWPSCAHVRYLKIQTRLGCKDYFILEYIVLVTPHPPPLPLWAPSPPPVATLLHQ